MSIILENSNLLPYDFIGVYESIKTIPVYQNQRDTPLYTTKISSPVQVVGLVPVFPCCIPQDAKGGFVFGFTDNYNCVGSGTGFVQMIIDLIIGGVDLGTFSFGYNDSAATIQAALDFILPTGFTSMVTVSSSLIRTFVILSPSGSGNTHNGITIQAIDVNNQCGLIKSTYNFQGGNSDSNACLNCDCRQGEYLADSIADDRYFVLPVFADSTCTDSYHNDVNSWIFQYPGTYNPIQNHDFKLQKLINGVWTDIALLNNTNYGTPLYTGNICSNNYGGYQISWSLVLSQLGEGTYRFTVNGSYNENTPYCFFSPPFCLKQFDCNLTDGTVKFETSSCGGNFGSVTDQGVSWSVCCSPINGYIVNNTCTSTPLSSGQSGPLPYTDSIRFAGYFGRETADYNEDFIKMATGYIQKVRQEAVKSFTLSTDLLPFWFHQRFYSYGLMADNCYVSDYNMNNPNYNIKHFAVKRNASYTIKYDNNSLRMKKVLDMKFVEQIQFTYRDQCC